MLRLIHKKSRSLWNLSLLGRLSFVNSEDRDIRIWIDSAAILTTMEHTHATLGGTFDHFHIGHEEFISAAFAQAEKVTIGIVQKNLSDDKVLADSIEPYEIREKNVVNFLKEKSFFERATILPIHDIYGTTLTDTTIDALFITEETKKNAERINEERQKNDMPPLPLILISYIYADDGKIMSSARIRLGEIDRNGQSYIKFFLQKDIYKLPTDLRKKLQKPIGRIVSESKKIEENIVKTTLCFTIGDIVSLTLKEAGYTPAISIIDFRTQRQAIDRERIEKVFPTTAKRLENPAGTINTAIAEDFQLCLQTFQQTNQTQVIVIDGEEDLLALPIILFAPLHSVVVYGQYDQGMVLVEVDEEKKAFVKGLLALF